MAQKKERRHRQKEAHFLKLFLGVQKSWKQLQYVVVLFIHTPFRDTPNKLFSILKKKVDSPKVISSKTCVFAKCTLFMDLKFFSFTLSPFWIRKCVSEMKMINGCYQIVLYHSKCFNHFLFFSNAETSSFTDEFSKESERNRRFNLHPIFSKPP